MKKINLSHVLIVIILLLGSVIMIGPLLWMVSTSLKDKSGVFQLPPQWIPNPVRLDAYKRLLDLDTLTSGIKNTVIVSLTVTIIGTITSSMAAFSFAKLKMPFKNLLFLILYINLLLCF